jgi:hypothetical protein
LVGNLLGYAQRQQAAGDALAEPHLHRDVKLLSLLFCQKLRQVHSSPSEPDCGSRLEPAEPQAPVLCLSGQVVELEEAQVAYQQGARLRALAKADCAVVGAASLKERAFKTARAQFQAQMGFQGSGNLAAGAATARELAGQGIRQADAGAVVEQHGGKASQQRDGNRVGSDHLGDGGLKNLLQAGDRSL